MNETIKKPKKTGMITLRLGKEEEDMIEALRGHPHYVNISKYLRDSIKHLYTSKTNKAGRV